MTSVPPGVAVAGCVAGDALAVEGTPNSTRRVWRVQNPSCGTAELVEVGQMSHSVCSIAFAHGRLFGIGCGAGIREFDPQTFQSKSGLIDLSPTAGTCGVAFDGVDTWYALGNNGVTHMLFRFADPPTAGGLMEVGNPGIDGTDCGLEYFAGVLWGGFRGPAARLYVGTFNLQTGAFTVVWDRPQVGTNSLGMMMLPERSTTIGDVNCDGDVDHLDVAPFVLALTNPSAFNAALPNCNLFNVDVSGDCLVNGSDIQPFVNVLLSPCAAYQGLLGDVNGDGGVDGRDVQPFVTLLLIGELEGVVNCAADFVRDGIIDVSDVRLFVLALLNG